MPVTKHLNGIHAHDGEYFPLFDYLRIGLAVGVFAAHADRFHVMPKDFGNACVQVFFALSGFLIAGILLKSTRQSLPRFYFNRCTRIWIPYAVAIAVLFAGTALRQSLSDPKIWEFFFYKSTFVYNIYGPPQLSAYGLRMPLQGTGNHFWSICVEEQFYLVAPFAIVFLPSWRILISLALLALNFVLPHNFSSIVLGVLLALSRHKFGQWYLRPVWTVAVGMTLFVALGAIARGWVPYAIGIPPAAVAVIALLGRPGAQKPLGTLLGGMSYPFYLNHWVGIFLRKTIERHLHLGMFVGSLGALAVALGLSAIHYRWIDSVVLRKRSGWYSSHRGVRACAVGFSLVVVGLVGGLILHLRPLR